MRSKKVVGEPCIGYEPHLLRAYIGYEPIYECKPPEREEWMKMVVRGPGKREAL